MAIRTRRGTGRAMLALLGLLALPLGTAAAQTAPRFERIFAFGDSYLDTGNAARLQGGLGPNYPTGRYSGGTNLVDSLQATYGLPPDRVINPAIGGAQTGSTNVNPNLPGFAQEIAEFAASGQRIGPQDLLLLSIGGNDRRQLPANATPEQVRDLALRSAENALAGVRQLVARGARTVAWVLPGDAALFPDAPASVPPFAATFIAALREGLEPMQREGVRVVLLDYTALLRRVQAEPARYGFTTANTACTRVPACLSAPRTEQDRSFFYDPIHPTSAGFALIARELDAALREGSATPQP